MSAVRDIEFTQIAADWNSITLGEENPQALLAIRNGLTTKQDQGSGDYKVSRIETIGNGWIDETRVRFASDLKEKDVEKYRIQKGDILFSHINSDPHLGKTGFAERDYEDLLHGMNLLLIRANPEVFDAEFLNRVFQYYRDIGVFVSICSRSVNQSSINQAKLKAVEVPLPPRPEQKKIAHILSTVQRAIVAQERIIQTTTELKMALMHRLFTEGLRNEPQKQTEIGPVPESWEVRKLGEIATTISKGSSPKWQGFQYTESGILFVRSQNVGSGKMLLDDRAYLPPTFNQKEKRSILQSGDILINLVGASIGRVALGTDDIEGGNCNQAVGFVRLDGSEALKQLIVHFLLSPWGQEQMRRQKKDIARANLSLLDVRGFEIPIPPTEEEIEEVARALVTLQEKTATHERKRDRLQDLFRTLLHELMTAKTRVCSVELSGIQ